MTQKDTSTTRVVLWAGRWPWVTYKALPNDELAEMTAYALRWGLAIEIGEAGSQLLEYLRRAA